jgi:PhnB protein
MNKRRAVIEPWLTISQGEYAVDFYKSAFSVIETYRQTNPEGGFVVRLEINGAGFWISCEGDYHKTGLAKNENTVRLILIVDNPDALFAQAIKAGAKEVFPIAEAHGWKLGRLSDPFGLHWEIGHEIE